MKIPPLPPDEPQRLKALHDYGIMDTLPEPEFDDITALAAEICGTPIALISLIDETRQWFKSKVGLTTAETSREEAFCAHALTGNKILLVPDAQLDQRFADNPSVTGDPKIRFYAGAPLVTPGGETLGTLCVIDRVPRQLTDRQQHALRVLSRHVMTQLELRRQARELAGRERLLQAVFDSEPECVKLLGPDGSLRMMNRAGLAIIEADTFGQVAGLGVDSLVAAEHRAAFNALTGRVFRGDSGRLEFQLTGLKGGTRWLETHAAPLRDEHGEITALLGVTRDITGRKHTEEALAIKSEILTAVTESLSAYVDRGDWREALGRLLRCALSETRSEYGFIGVVVGESSLRVLAHEGIVWDKILNREFYEQALRRYAEVGYLEFTNFNNLFGRAITTGGVVMANLPARDARSGGLPPGHPPMHSFLGVPIFAGSQVTGVVALANRPGGYSEEDQRRIVTLVQHAGGLCTSYRLHETALGVEQERRKAEQAMRVSYERFQLLAKATNDAIWDWDLTSNLLWWNEGYEKLFGHRREQADPSLKSWTDYLHPEDLARVTDGIHQVIEHGGTAWTDEYRFRCADGSYRHVLDRGYIIRDAAARPVRMIGGMTDQTERKQAAEALDQSREVLRLTLNAAQIGYWDIDLVTRRANRSEQHDRIFGYAQKLEEWTYDKFLGHVHPEDRERVDGLFQAGVAAKDQWEFECRILRSDGQRRWIWAYGKVFTDPAGSAARILGVVSDITERKQTEVSLVEANRALQMLSRCNEALIRSENETDLLAAVCQTAVDLGGFRLAWVGYALDDARKTIRPRSHAGTEEGYLSKLEVTWAETTPLGQGPAGRVIRSGEPVVIPDLEADESFRPWLAAAKARGFKGVVGLPLKETTHTFGVLVLYLPEARTPFPDEMRLLRELGNNVAFGIVNLRATQERLRLEQAVMKMAVAVSATTDQEFFEQLAGNMAQALGAQGGFVARLLPGEPQKARTIAAVIDGRVTDNFDYLTSGTPCENFRSTDTCIVPQRVAELFPDSPSLTTLGAQAYAGRRLDSSTGEPLGFLFVVYRERLKRNDFIVSTLKIFAARATGELERRRADLRLQEQAELLDKARDAILVRDLEHRITFWNKSAERLYGWPATEAVGRSVRDMLYFDPGVYDQAMEQLLAQDEWSGEVVHLRKDGEQLAIEVRWTLVRDDKGRPRSVLAINTDITERKKLEQQFLRAQRMESIGTLAGGIAHDLNNLLAPITMGVGLLRQFEPNPRSLPVIENMERSARRGADLIKQVLSFARGVEGSRVPLQVSHIIREVESIAANTFPRNIRLQASLAPDLWLVLADPTQLNQVILNLCVNARDAMPDGGRLELAASNVEIDEQYAAMNRGVAAGRYVMLQVTDSGCGIPREIVDRIFEPFFTTKEFGTGTGLGLSSVQGIVRSHGGFVNVYSEVGKGSTFKVYLPAQAADAVLAAAHAAAEMLPRGNGELILLVDDEASILDITKQTLETFGYKVLTAEDGALAIGLYAQQRDRIAAVITDMMMPVMDGPALIAALRRINPKARIIAASGLNANGNVARAAGAGVKHFLAKPYSADAMLTLLKQVLAEKGSRPPM